MWKQNYNKIQYWEKKNMYVSSLALSINEKPSVRSEQLTL